MKSSFLNLEKTKIDLRNLEVHVIKCKKIYRYVVFYLLNGNDFWFTEAIVSFEKFDSCILVQPCEIGQTSM